MRKTTKLAGAIAAAGIVAAGASAFTASSTIDNANKYVGAASQTISGVHVSNVSYNWQASDDTTSGVSFHTQEVLGTNDNLAVSLAGDNTSGSSCDATAGTSGGSDYTCTFTTAVTNAQSLSIVVN